MADMEELCFSDSEIEAHESVSKGSTRVKISHVARINESLEEFQEVLTIKSRASMWFTEASVGQDLESLVLNMASKAAPAALFVLLNLLSLAFATYPPTPYGTCPDTLKLDVCVTVFNNWLSVTDADKQKCCDLLTGVAALDVNACICAAIDISSLAGIIPININLLFNQCKWTKPADFHCKL
ncbi:hypothetical protein J5N97_029605 [Dioscorea zingiberensis]|uniref:Hydrophobic seed protein domain-containing protein n=1 Tax=Dioscorea zingiberensis TaxID=325984 RepID=A0A9D5BVP8_9LILI|nr:hypothetical protein J5N97_029605 [Dioscorea zingiberensis]